MLCHSSIYIVKASSLPFTKVLGQIDQLQKDSFGKRYEWTLVSESSILAKKCSKIDQRMFWSLQTILLCIVGEIAGGGSMAVAEGVSDM